MAGSSPANVSGSADAASPAPRGSSGEQGGVLGGAQGRPARLAMPLPIWVNILRHHAGCRADAEQRELASGRPLLEVSSTMPPRTSRTDRGAVQQAFGARYVTAKLPGAIRRCAVDQVAISWRTGNFDREGAGADGAAVSDRTRWKAGR